MSHIFTSDLHLDHRNILKYTKRPWGSLLDMQEGIRTYWNQTVSPKDDIWILGDTYFSSDFEWLRNFMASVSGRKHFLLGNHDNPGTLTRLLKYPETRTVSVDLYRELKHNKQMYVLFHYPIESWRNCHHGSVHLHGHCHGNLKTYQERKRLDVGLDNHPEHRFFTLEDIDAIMSKRGQLNGPDHHQKGGDNE